MTVTHNQRPLIKGEWYQLHPPAIIGAKSFSKLCFLRTVPIEDRTYIIAKGRPDSGGEERKVILFPNTDPPIRFERCSPDGEMKRAG